MWKIKLWVLGVLGVLIISQSGCETDIDIIAPSRDVTIIYGLLEVNKSRHFVRVNKGFIDEQSATELAKEPGINEYSDEEMVGRVIELNANGNPTDRSWELIPTYITTKEEGAFANDSNKVYYFDADLDITKTYRIECDVRVEGEELKVVYAETPVLGSITEVTLSKPRKAVNNNEERLEVSFIGQGDYRTESIVEWQNVPDGAASFTCYYRYYYWEYDSVSNVRTKDSLTFDAGNPISSGATAQFKINPEEFYIRVNDNIEDYDFNAATFERYAGDTLQFFLEIADNTLATYIRVNQPATEVLQEQPEYTNVVNGIGIWASRLIVTTKAKSDPQSHGRVMDTKTLSELVLSDQITNIEDSYKTVEKGFVSRRCQRDNNGILQCK